MSGATRMDQDPEVCSQSVRGNPADSSVAPSWIKQDAQDRSRQHVVGHDLGFFINSSGAMLSVQEWRQLAWLLLARAQSHGHSLHLLLFAKVLLRGTGCTEGKPLHEVRRRSAQAYWPRILKSCNPARTHIALVPHPYRTQKIWLGDHMASSSCTAGLQQSQQA